MQSGIFLCPTNFSCGQSSASIEQTIQRDRPLSSLHYLVGITAERKRKKGST